MELEAIGEIYRGSHHSIFLARLSSKEKPELIALKYGKKDIIGKCLTNEAAVLQGLGGIKAVPEMKLFIQNSESVFLGVETLPGGDLMRHLLTNERLDINTCRVIVAQLLKALKQIGTRGYIHRDLRPENIVFDKEGYLKVIDFGLAHREGEVADSSLGSVDYMAPEILMNPEPYSSSIDLWSVGVILYEMLFGGPPFSDEKRERNRTIFRIIHSEKYLWFPPQPDTEYKSAESFLRRLLCPMSERFSDATEAMSHDFFSSIDWDRIPSVADRLPEYNLLANFNILKTRKLLFSFKQEIPRGI